MRTQVSHITSSQNSNIEFIQWFTRIVLIKLHNTSDVA